MGRDSAVDDGEVNLLLIWLWCQGFPHGEEIGCGLEFTKCNISKQPSPLTKKTVSSSVKSRKQDGSSFEECVGWGVRTTHTYTHNGSFFGGGEWGFETGFLCATDSPHCPRI